MRVPWLLGGCALVVTLTALGEATPHSGMLSGPTARTWWETARTSFGYTTPGASGSRRIRSGIVVLVLCWCARGRFSRDRRERVVDVNPCY